MEVDASLMPNVPGSLFLAHGNQEDSAFESCQEPSMEKWKLPDLPCPMILSEMLVVECLPPGWSFQASSLHIPPSARMSFLDDPS